MKNKAFILSISLLFFSFVSCKSPLSKNQEEIVKPFNTGDTLIFKSKSNHFDTIVICEKSKSFRNVNPIFGNTFYKPEDLYVKYYTTKQGKDFVYDLIHIYGGETPEDARIVISMRTFYCFLSETRGDLGKKTTYPISIADKIYNNYYIRTPECDNCQLEKDSCNINKLFWDIKKGPLQYIDVKNDVWTRVK